MKTEKVTFGAGCFWGVEETFRRLGRREIYAGRLHGRNKENPTYEDVCTDTTGHAEVVEIEFDPQVIATTICWKFSGPTTIRPRSTGRVRTLARSIAQRSFIIRPSK